MVILKLELKLRFSFWEVYLQTFAFLGVCKLYNLRKKFTTRPEINLPLTKRIKQCEMLLFSGMTHVQRELQRPGSKALKKSIVEGVTLVECPPMVAVGFVGYQQTVRGLKALGTVWASIVDAAFKRRFYTNGYHFVFVFFGLKL